MRQPHGTKTLRYTPLLVIGLSLAASSAFAQDATPQPATAPADKAAPAKTAWEDLDLNNDGNLSKEETVALPALHDVFDRADANADGALTGDEYRTYLATTKADDGKPLKDKK